MIDVNKPLENPVLKEMFSQMGQENNPELQNRILDEIIMRAHFLSYVIIDEPLEIEKKENGAGILKKEATFSFPTISSSDEKIFYPVFIDWEELGKWNIFENKDKDKISTLILKFDDYAHMVLSNNDIEGFVINPFSENPFSLTKEWLKILTKEKEERLKVQQKKIEKDTTVMVGDAKEYPEEMLKALKFSCENNENIKKLWLMLMNNNGEESYLLVIEGTGDKKDIMNKIAHDVIPYSQGKYLDMFSSTDTFGQNVISNRKPFYEK